MMEQNGYAVDYGDAYMEQEEEWEREGLLDPAWEKQQKKVTTTNHSIRFPYLLFYFYNFFLPYLVIFCAILSASTVKLLYSTNSKRNEYKIKVMIQHK